MPSHDFEVDIEALITAAQKTSEAVQLKKDNDISDYVPTQADLANDIMWSAVDEFQSRWERGINNMTDDITEVAGRLGKVASNYIDYDTKAAQEMSQLASVAAQLPGLAGKR